MRWHSDGEKSSQPGDVPEGSEVGAIAEDIPAEVGDISTKVLGLSLDRHVGMPP